jgi:uncharacterized membrane protein
VENKYVGYLILGVSVLMIMIIVLFNNALEDIVSSSCSMAGHGDSCPMYDTIAKQTNLSFGIVAILILIGIVLVFSKPYKEVIIRTVEKKRRPKKFDLSDLKSEEKIVFNLVRVNKTIFQADLIDKTDIGKAKMTRIIDKLEGRGFVERKRRGMTNVVVLKED